MKLVKTLWRDYPTTIVVSVVGATLMTTFLKVADNPYFWLPLLGIPFAALLIYGGYHGDNS